MNNALQIDVNDHDIRTPNYTVRLRRPDGVELVIAIPDETQSELNDFLRDSNEDYPIGLNLVFAGHYV